MVRACSEQDWAVALSQGHGVVASRQWRAHKRSMVTCYDLPPVSSLLLFFKVIIF